MKEKNPLECCACFVLKGHYLNPTRTSSAMGLTHNATANASWQGRLVAAWGPARFNRTWVRLTYQLGGLIGSADLRPAESPAGPRGALLVRTRPQRGGGGGGGALRTPKLSHGTRCFVGAGGAGDFALGIRRGEFFLFHPMCLYSKYSEFCGEFKNG